VPPPENDSATTVSPPTSGRPAGMALVPSGVAWTLIGSLNRVAHAPTSRPSASAGRTRHPGGGRRRGRHHAFATRERELKLVCPLPPTPMDNCHAPLAGI